MIDHRDLRAFAGGAAVGTLGGLIGLGGAEFRLPLLIGPFRFKALDAVILNKTMSLVVVASSLVFRSGTIPLTQIAAHWPIVLNLLAGSLLGAWLGASWALRLKAEGLYRVIAALLVVIAVVLGARCESGRCTTNRRCSNDRRCGCGICDRGRGIPDGRRGW